MNRIVLLAICIVALVGLGVGCSIARSPISYSLYADVQDGMAVGTGDLANAKVGEASAMSIIGITTGDCSITTAAKAGGLKKIYYVDYHSKGILGLWANTTTKVYGE